jgi:hypothetical protein
MPRRAMLRRLGSSDCEDTIYSPPRAPLPLRRRTLQRVVPSMRSGNRAPQVPLSVALALPPTSPFSPSVPPGNRPAQAQPSHWRRAARSATPCGTALWCSKASRSPGLVVLESEPRLPPYPSAVPQGNRAPHPARHSLPSRGEEAPPHQCTTRGLHASRHLDTLRSVAQTN